MIARPTANPTPPAPGNRLRPKPKPTKCLPWASRRERSAVTRRPLGVCLLLLVALALPATAARADEPATAPAGRCRALIVTGLPGTPVHARRYADWAQRFGAVLIAGGARAEDVTVLSGDDARAGEAWVTGPASAETVLSAVGALARQAQPADQVVLVLLGHGWADDRQAGLVLAGPDLSADRLAEALAPCRAGLQVVLSFHGAGGDFLPALSAAGRVVIAPAGPGGTVEPVYPEFFLRALETARADGHGQAADSTVTLLEAYNEAAFRTAQWVTRIRQSPNGRWRLDGAEAIEVFRTLYGGGGPGSRPLDPASDASGPDAEVELRPADGQVSPEWMGRRVLAELPVLEDGGQREVFVSALRPPGEPLGYAPLTGQRPGDPGWLAGRIVLGQAQPLPAK